jgi:hypothetical protein
VVRVLCGSNRLALPFLSRFFALFWLCSAQADVISLFWQKVRVSIRVVRLQIQDIPEIGTMETNNRNSRNNSPLKIETTKFKYSPEMVAQQHPVQ